MDEEKNAKDEKTNNLSHYAALLAILNSRDEYSSGMVVSEEDADNAGIDILLLDAMLESDKDERQRAIDNYIKTRAYRDILRANPVLGSILISKSRRKDKDKDDLSTAVAAAVMMQRRTHRQNLDDLALCLANLGEDGLPTCLFLHHVPPRRGRRSSAPSRGRRSGRRGRRSRGQRGRRSRGRPGLSRHKARSSGRRAGRYYGKS